MQQIITVTTIVSTADDDGHRRALQIKGRDEELSGLNQHGYVLHSTVSIPGSERMSILDTLTREDPTA